MCCASWERMKYTTACRFTYYRSQVNLLPVIIFSLEGGGGASTLFMLPCYILCASSQVKETKCKLCQLIL